MIEDSDKDPLRLQWIFALGDFHENSNIFNFVWCGAARFIMGAGISKTDLLITAVVIFLNAAFQILARGNEGWAKRPNYSKVSEKMPTWVYSFVSSIGLIVIVFIVTKATSAIWRIVDL